MEPVWPQEVSAADKKNYCHNETSPVPPPSVHSREQRSVPLVWWCLCDTPSSVALAVVGQGPLSSALWYVSCMCFETSLLRK